MRRLIIFFVPSISFVRNPLYALHVSDFSSQSWKSKVRLLCLDHSRPAGIFLTLALCLNSKTSNSPSSATPNNPSSKHSELPRRLRASHGPTSSSVKEVNFWTRRSESSLLTGASTSLTGVFNGRASTDNPICYTKTSSKQALEFIKSLGSASS